MEKDRFKVGDKFIIEIGSSYWSPSTGNRYFIKGFNTLCFDDRGLEKLEPCKAYNEPRCSDCVYSGIDADVYPCSMCYRGDPREEKFLPKGSIISGKR